jgi:hypothetical protein
MRKVVFFSATLRHFLEGGGSLAIRRSPQLHSVPGYDRNIDARLAFTHGIGWLLQPGRPRREL